MIAPHSFFSLLDPPRFSSIWMILTPTKPPQEPVAHLRRADLVAPLLLLLPRVPGNPQGGVLVTLHHRHPHRHNHLVQRLVDACSTSNSRWRVGGRATRGSDSVWAVLTGEVILIMLHTGEVILIMIMMVVNMIFLIIKITVDIQ